MAVHSSDHSGSIITKKAIVKVKTGTTPHLATKSPVAQHGSGHKKT